MSWGPHRPHPILEGPCIGNTMSSRLGNLRRAHKVLPKSTCLMLYNTLVLPLFDYCSSVWGSCGVGSKSYLDKLNRRTACIIIEGRPISSDELKLTLGWPRLQAHRDYLKCVLVYKCLHGMAPLYLLSEFRHVHQVHGYNTRSHDLLAASSSCEDR